MKVKFTPHNVTFTREEGDPKFYGVKGGKGESRFLNYIKKWLNSNGFEVVKKLAWKDGHMLDNYQQYIRMARGTKAPHIYILSGFHAIEGAEKPWNKGKVTLQLEINVDDKQPDCYWKIITLGLMHGFEVQPFQTIKVL